MFACLPACRPTLPISLPTYVLHKHLLLTWNRPSCIVLLSRPRHVSAVHLHQQRTYPTDREDCQHHVSQRQLRHPLRQPRPLSLPPLSVPSTTNTPHPHPHPHPRVPACLASFYAANLLCIPYIKPYWASRHRLFLLSSTYGEIWTVLNPEHIICRQVDASMTRTSDTCQDLTN